MEMDVLDELARLIDSSCETGTRNNLDKALQTIETCLASDEYKEQDAVLHYFAANAWAGIRRVVQSDRKNALDWEHRELEAEIRHLRLAMRSESFASLPLVRRCQIITNLGNSLSVVGRVIEAFEYWNRAIQLDPDFGMALGNRGEAYCYYAVVLYDKHHQHILFRQAALDLRRSVSVGVYAQPSEYFRGLEERIVERLGEPYITEGDDLQSFDLGRTRKEREYRNWCLTEGLFLNPLNDLGAFPSAARDVFSCPSISVRGKRGPCHHGFFNQMKQEFVSARFLYFEGTSSRKPHISDREVLLHNTLDYPSYSFSVEMTKLAFRSAYSILDKVAFFLNDYLGLKIPARSVAFKSLWYKKQKVANGLREEFAKINNWPMRGLFSLSKDLHTNDQNFQSVMEPDAQALGDLRNHAEHKYLKLHELYSAEFTAMSGEIGLKDDLAYSMRRADFESKSLRMLKLARAALMYLSLGVHWEERQRKNELGANAIFIPIDIGTIDDKDKI